MANQYDPSDDDTAPLPPSRLSQALGELSFDARKLKLPHAAALGFAVGILFHACVAMAVLNGGSSAADTAGAGTGSEPGIEIVTQPTAEPAETVVPVDDGGDRTNCDLIAGTDYRSAAERQWYIDNCT